MSGPSNNTRALISATFLFVGSGLLLHLVGTVLHRDFDVGVALLSGVAGLLAVSTLCSIGQDLHDGEK